MIILSFRSLICLFIITLPFSSQASWEFSLIDHAKNYKYDYVDTFASTVESICHKPIFKFKNVKGKVEDHRVFSSYLFSKRMPVKLAVKMKGKHPVSAPVMIFIPGAFNNLESNQTRRMANVFIELGYHVLLLPNPWGTDYLGEKASRPLGTITVEGKAIYEVIRNSIKMMRERNLIKGKINLMGISYGGFLSGMIKAFDSEAPVSILSGSTTIISPPLDMRVTLNQLDKFIAEVKDYMGYSSVKILNQFRSFCKLDSYDELTKKDLRIAKGIATSQGFHVDLVKSAIKYNKVWNFDALPKSWLGLSPNYKKWKKNYTFNNFFTQFNSTGRKILASKLGKLNYWIQRAKESGGRDIRILIAKDDFLNTADIKNNRNNIVLETGGHYGFRHLKWFKVFLEKAFTLK